MSLGFMSFSSENETNLTIEEAFGCCTAIIYYKGVAVKSFTECGIDTGLSCRIAEKKAQNWILKNQNEPEFTPE